MIVNLERRLRKLEAQRFAAEPALKAMPDDELAQALRDASNDPSDHAFADWFQDGTNGPLPPGALDAIKRSL